MRYNISERYNWYVYDGRNFLKYNMINKFTFYNMNKLITTCKDNLHSHQKILEFFLWVWGNKCVFVAKGIKCLIWCICFFHNKTTCACRPFAIFMWSNSAASLVLFCFYHHISSSSPVAISVRVHLNMAHIKYQQKQNDWKLKNWHWTMNMAREVCEFVRFTAIKNWRQVRQELACSWIESR